MVLDNDFGYPIGETVDDPVKEFNQFIEWCSLDFNQLYLDILDQFEQTGRWYLYTGQKCYDKPTFEDVKEDYIRDFMSMWHEVKDLEA